MFQAPTVRLPSGPEPLALKANREAGTLLAAHIKDGKDLLKRLRAVTDCEFHSQFQLLCTATNEMYNCDSENLYSTYH